MLKSVRVSLFAIALVIVLIAGIVLLTSFTARSDDHLNGDDFTVEIKYYDSVAIYYTLNYPTGGVWSGNADIPIGGLRRSTGGDLIISQVYCVDPFVSFHAFADTSDWLGPIVTNRYRDVYNRWGSEPGPVINYRPEGERWAATTTDIKAGYVAAAPWTSSGAVRQNADAVSWLILNGYRGDFRVHDGESDKSLERLKDMYPSIENIDKTVAVMATKVALWRLLTYDNPSAVDISGTSLDRAPLWRQTFDRLVEDLVHDAFEYQNRLAPQPGDLEHTQLCLTINDSNTLPVTDSGYVYYGPLNVTAELLDLPLGTDLETLTVEDIFLTVGGIDSSGISFVTAQTASAPSLERGTIPGTADETYYTNVDYDEHTETWISGDFYLKISTSRTEELDLLTIRAMGMAPKVPVIEGTPVVLVYQHADGVQDWNAVQAFIGAAKPGSLIDLYDEASLNIQNSPLGEIYVAKQVVNATPLDQDVEFTFQVRYINATNISGAIIGSSEVLDLTEHPVHGAYSVDTVANTFNLRNGQLAMIQDLPIQDYYYWVVESSSSGYDTPQFTIPQAEDPINPISPTPKPPAIPYVGGGWATEAFQIDHDLDYGFAFVAFFNSRTDQKANLQITKRALTSNADYLLDTQFTFILERSADRTTWAGVPLTSENFVSSGGPHGSGGSIVPGVVGAFTLRSFETAFIEVDPVDYYRLTEVDPGDTDVRDWWTAYGIVGVEDGMLAWTIPDPPIPDVTDQPGPRITESFEVKPGGTYYISFTNMPDESLELSIKKIVSGSGATQNDYNRMFQFRLFHSEEPDAPLEPIAFSVDGGWMTLPEGIFWTCGVTIFDANGVPLGREATANRLKTTMIDTAHIGRDWGELEIPVIVELRHNETATIKGLIPGNYVIRELDTDTDYSITYSISGATEAGGTGADTEVFPVIGDTQVVFTNNVDFLGDIIIQKILTNAAPSDTTGPNALEFRFAVYYNPDSPVFDDSEKTQRLDLSEYPPLNALSVDTVTNTFTLLNGGQARIVNLPAEYYYWVAEIDPDLDDFETPVYRIPISAPTQIPDLGWLATEKIDPNDDYRTRAFQIRKDMAEAMVTFSNTKITHDANLRIGKIGLRLSQDGAIFEDVRGEAYTFVLQSSTNGSTGWTPVNLTADVFEIQATIPTPNGEIGGGYIVGPTNNGRFALFNYGIAYVKVDPGLFYRVIEEYADSFSASHTLSRYDSESQRWTPIAGNNTGNYLTDRRNHPVTNGFIVEPDNTYLLLFTNMDVPEYDLTISKTVGGGGDRNRLFGFEVMYVGDALGGPWPVPLTTNPDNHSAFYVEGVGNLNLAAGNRVDGTKLWLRHDESAIIHGLPAGTYYVIEDSVEGYDASNSIIVGQGATNRPGSETAPFPLIEDTQVVFKNDVIQLVGDISIRKILTNGMPEDNNGPDALEFRFAVYYNPSVPVFGDSGTRLLNLTEYPPQGALAVDTDNNTFTLYNGGVAHISDVLLNHYYWVVELDVDLGEFEFPMYRIPVSAPPAQTIWMPAINTDQGNPDSGNYRTSAFQINPNTLTAVVSFTNTKGDSDARLRIGKVALRLDEDGYALEEVWGEPFIFVIQYSDNPTTGWAPVTLTEENFYVQEAIPDPNGEYGGGYIVGPASDGRFALFHYGMAFIDLEPDLYYRVIEELTDDYASDYVLVEYDEDTQSWNTIMGTQAGAYWHDKGNQPTTGGFNVEQDKTYMLIFTNVDVPVNDLTITKTVGGSGDRNLLFEFEVFYMGSALGVPVPWAIPLTTNPDNKEAFYVEGAGSLDLATENRVDGSKILLRHGESAIIHNLPKGSYNVRETSPSGYSTSSNVIAGGSSTRRDGNETGEFPILDDTAVVFTNIIPIPELPRPPIPNVPERPNVPEEPEEPNEPDEPNEPGEPEEPEEPSEPGEPEEPEEPGEPPGNNVPQTDDRRNPIVPIAMILLGFALIAGAAIFRKRGRKKGT